MNAASKPSLPTRMVDALLRLAAAGGLAVDAYVHAHLASDFDVIGGTISQGVLFRLESAVASLIALLLVLLPRRRWLYLLAAVVAASALGAVLLYRYVNVGAIGPLPNMYEPVWYFQKTLSAYAEASAAVLAIAGLVVTVVGQGWRRDRGPSLAPVPFETAS